MFCPYCGKELNENNICTNPSCPTNINRNDETLFDTKESISDIEIQEFIGDKNTNYYLEKWYMFKRDQNFKSWNWPAFLISPWWFWYRKMYLAAAIIFVVNILFNNLESSSLSSIITIAINICSGLFSNQLYMRFAKKKIETIKTNRLTPNEMFLEKIHATGGVTLVPAIIVAILFILITIGCVMFFSIISNILS